MTACGVDVGDFATWYAEALEEVGLTLRPADAIDQPDRSDLPASLRGWYRIAGNSPLNSAHNLIFSADQLREHDGKVIFAEENQEVVVWAYEAGDTDHDPEVWQGQPDPTGHALTWYSEELQLSRFLIEMLRHTVDPGRR